jgi:hypothetical protein
LKKKKKKKKMKNKIPNFEEGLKYWLEQEVLFPLTHLGEGRKPKGGLNWSKMKRKDWFRIKNVSEESIEEMYVESEEE